jgi:hypothetical protein
MKSEMTEPERACHVGTAFISDEFQVGWRYVDCARFAEESINDMISKINQFN